MSRHDPEMVEALCLGLAAQDYIRTASRGPWVRYGKFRYFSEGGGEAYYVLPDGTLWYSPLRDTSPQAQVQGPILDSIFGAGMKAGAAIDVAFRPSLNADEMLKEIE